MALTNYEMRKRAWDDIKRVVYQQEIKNGNTRPSLREAEKKADEVANRVDRQKGR